MKRSTPMNDPTLAARVAALPDLAMPELWALWDRHFPRRPRHHNRDYVEARVAYRIQEEAHGGLAPDIARSLAQLGAAQSRRGGRRGVEVRLPPGSVLLREFDGAEHRVVVAPDGLYVWNGERFRSLSAVARRITGVAWSGPAFFGLTQRGST